MNSKFLSSSELDSEANNSRYSNKNQLVRLKYQNNSSGIFPNLPANPINGLIKTYDVVNREFTKPYNAKTVFFYKDGDNYFTVVS